MVNHLLIRMSLSVTSGKFYFFIFNLGSSHKLHKYYLAIKNFTEPSDNGDSMILNNYKTT